MEVKGNVPIYSNLTQEGNMDNIKIITVKENISMLLINKNFLIHTKNKRNERKRLIINNRSKGHLSFRFY